jgi:hypothetical protein
VVGAEEIKLEARIPKFETISKWQKYKIRNIMFWKFGFRICFEFRYSDFEFLRTKKEDEA